MTDAVCVIISIMIVLTVILYLLVASLPETSLEEQAECIRINREELEERKRRRQEKHRRKRE